MERLEEIRHQNELVDKYCKEIGRDPRTLRRSYSFYNHNVIVQRGLFDYYESEDAFKEKVRPFIDIGIREVLIDYPCRDEQLPMFEKIAKEIIPELKAEYNK